MTLRDTILNQYKNSHQAIIIQLDEIEKNRKIYPLWTIREIVAHLSGWDDAAIGFLNALLKGEQQPTPAMRGVDVYNEETVSTREGLSYDHIVREYLKTREKLFALIQQSSDEVLRTQDTLPWGDKGSFQEIVEELTEHELTHAEDIRKFIEEHKVQ